MQCDAMQALRVYLLSEKGQHSYLARFLGCHAITMYTQQIIFVVMTDALLAGVGHTKL